ncbi:MAG: hypothetical protein ACLU37_05560 [Collinsella sp.]
MAGKGRASVNDMKRVEVQVLMEIASCPKTTADFMAFRARRLPSVWGCSVSCPRAQ